MHKSEFPAESHIGNRVLGESGRENGRLLEEKGELMEHRERRWQHTLGQVMIGDACFEPFWEERGR